MEKAWKLETSNSLLSKQEVLPEGEREREREREGGRRDGGTKEEEGSGKT
jgi:hypothetical protein